MSFVGPKIWNKLRSNMKTAATTASFILSPTVLLLSIYLFTYLFFHLFFFLTTDFFYYISSRSYL